MKKLLLFLILIVLMTICNRVKAQVPYYNYAHYHTDYVIISPKIDPLVPITLWIAGSLPFILGGENMSKSSRDIIGVSTWGIACTYMLYMELPLKRPKVKQFVRSHIFKKFKK